MLDNSLRNGSTLITNTMLYQAARFLNAPSESERSSIEGFFDLSSLVEAVVLRQRLYTLEGDVAKYYEDYSSLSLISELRNAGILFENAIPIDPIGVQRELVTIVGADRVFNQLNIRGMGLRIANLLPEVFPQETDYVVAHKNVPKFDRWNFIQALQHPSTAAMLSTSQNIFEFFRGDDFIEFIRGTGDSERGAYVLRTYIYSNTAQKERISFMPDYPRVPFLASIINRFHESVVMKKYRELASKLQCEADDFLKDAYPIGLPIPPFTSLLLNRCQSPEDIPQALLDLRDEFKDLRENITELEERLQNSKSIGERNKARKNVENIFTSVTKKYDDSGFTNFKSLVDFSGEAIGPAFNWTNPTAYSTSLVMQPIEWIRDWWFRRPLAQFFDISKQFRSIKHYNLLARKVFKVEFSTDEIEEFQRMQSTLSKMFSPEGGTSNGK